MITVNEIKKKSENIYKAYLQSIICDKIFFPKVLRSNKSVSSDFNEMRKELTEIVENSKDRKGFGYTIIYRQINTRKHGMQSLPEEISFQTESDFLKYLHKEKEAEQFRNDSQLILSSFPELKEWIIKSPLKIIENKDKWNDLLKVCNYFKSNPKPDSYIRELPIQIHTKFIENNEAIIKELLDHLIADLIQTDETKFEKRFNLKFDETSVRFRILDNHIAQTYFSGINDLCIPASQFEKLELPLKQVFVVENKMNVLTFPNIVATVVIFGSGYGGVANLKKVEWFNKTELFYWGDLDADGFQILSQFRGYFPHTKSILMDKETFDGFFENDKGTPSTKTALNLTDSENRLYELLKTNNWRLEQEKVLQEYVNEIIRLRLRQ